MLETSKAPLCEEADVVTALRLIQEAVNQMTGKSVPITPNTRMDRYFIEVVGADSLEYLDLSFRLEAKLGVKLSQDDWKFLTGDELCKDPGEWEAKYAPMFTFGRLAELVAHRAKFRKIEPETILGATSLPAGAFRRIEAIAKDFDPKIGSFAPSTPILDCFRGRPLQLFWGRLRVLSENRIPPLLVGRIDKTVAWLGGLWGVIFCLFLYGAIAWALAAFVGMSPASTISSWWFVFCFPPIALFFSSRLLLFVVDRMRPHSSILPNGIESFRDLAMLVAGERGGWCEKCGYDLTGLVSGRCPECGTEVARLALPFRGRGVHHPPHLRE